MINEEIITLNQDPLVYRARRLVDNGDLERWAKPLISSMSGKVAITLLNKSYKAATITFNIQKVGLDASENSYHEL